MYCDNTVFLLAPDYIPFADQFKLFINQFKLFNNQFKLFINQFNLFMLNIFPLKNYLKKLFKYEEIIVILKPMDNNDIQDGKKSPRHRVKYSSISDEKRENLSRLINDQNHSVKAAAEILQINYCTAKSIMHKFGKTNTLVKLPKGGSHKHVLTPQIVDAIEEIVSLNSNFTLKEIQDEIQKIGLSVRPISLSSINRCLMDLKITLKKCHRELDRVNAPNIIEQRKDYSLWFNNHFNNDFSNIVFVDESSFNLHLQRSQARSKQGTRAKAIIPTVRGRSATLIASIMANKMGFCKVVSNSTVNANLFSEYLFDLCAHLKEVMFIPDVCIILDNARIHKKDDIEIIVSQFNYTFKFLSPYSYMLNPIENAFSKIKNCVRSRLRTEENVILSEIILSEVNSITSEDCSGYFRYIARNITNCAAQIPYVHK